MYEKAARQGEASIGHFHVNALISWSLTGLTPERKIHSAESLRKEVHFLLYFPIILVTETSVLTHKQATST